MAKLINMPKLSMMMKSGTIVKWYRIEGERIEKGDPLYTVEYEKVVSDIQAGDSGVLLAILAPEGTTLNCFEPVAVIGEKGEPLPKEAVEAEKALIEPTPLQTSIKTLNEVEARTLASPFARKLIKQYDLDPKMIEGSGPRGRIQKEDVLKYIEEKVPAKTLESEYKVIPLSTIRKTIAEKLSKSYREALHATLNLQVDMSSASSLREDLSSKEGFKPSFTDIIVKVVAETLKAHNTLNATFEEEMLRVYNSVNINVAVSLEGGLVTPVIHGVDKLSLKEISISIREKVERARKRELTLEELLNGTFTITNLGMFDVESFSPIINPPQVAILAIGKIDRKPVVEDEAFKIKPLAYFTLTFDHRVIDGADAARFLTDLKDRLEDLSWLKAS